jgi:hypothetical protein
LGVFVRGLADRGSSPHTLSLAILRSGDLNREYESADCD